MYYPTTTIDRILSITDRSPQKRIQKIISQITRPHRIQHAPGVTNIIVPAKQQAGKIVLTAHHDLFTGSIGYNDNSTGVATLLRLQEYLPDDVELVFTDQEEHGGRGCTAYLEEQTKKKTMPRIAINVDVVGLGSKVFGAAYGNWEEINLDGTAIEFMESIPFSDSYILNHYGVPNILLVTGENRRSLIWDIFEAQHNGRNDGRLELISEAVLDKVFDTLTTLIKNNTGRANEKGKKYKNDHLQGLSRAGQDYRTPYRKASFGK